MCAKSSNSSFDEVAKRLEAAASLLVLSHARPDGDALGSMAAIALGAAEVGKSARVIAPHDPPAKYAFLLDGVKSAEPERFAELAAKHDCIVVVDTCAFSQLDGLKTALDENRDKTVVMDHHLTRDDIGSAQWIDASAAAAGVMVLEMLERLGWPIGAKAARALTTATLTDTGWLRFSNTDARALTAVGRLVELGVSLDEEYRRIYQCDRVERLRLKARVLEGLELHDDGRLAVMGLRLSDFEDTGASETETEDLINEALSIRTVEMAIMLTEADDTIRASLRSKGGVDVSQVAAQFGGGGHARAAGCRQAGPFDEFRAALAAASLEALEHCR